MEMYTKIAIFVLFLAGFLYYIKNCPTGLTTPDIIEKYGYVCETHYITTDDGYILKYFRIPNNTTKKGTVLIFHGLIGSSATFVQVGPERGLAFILSDAGYDVWLSNARGNQYSRNHKTYHPFWNSQKFYNFSIHEIGYYDIPNAIDYILQTTGQKSIHYVGLSLGTTVFFVFGSTRPAYQSKIKLASLMSPVARFEHFPQWTLTNILAQMVYEGEKLLNFVHLFELPATGFLREIVPMLCNISALLPICELFFTLGSGQRVYAAANKEFIPIITANSPSNTALKTLYHMGQLIKNGGFSYYDYGADQNLKVYGNTTPPSYNLSTIQTPLAIYYGSNDSIVSLKDAQNVLLQFTNLVYSYLIPSSNFSHASFIYSPDIKTLLYDKLLEVMNDY